MKEHESDYLTLQEQQNAFLELLKEFHQLCGKYQLRYDLCGGSLLGAVRHGGFIPWDDDIDVCMPRTDYEKLLKLQLEHRLELPEDRAIISDRDNTFQRHFARFIRKDIGMQDEMAEADDCPFLGMDIFAVDGVPEDDAELKRQCWKIRQLRRFLLTSVERKNTSRKGKAAAAIKNLYRPLLKLYGSNRLARKLDQVCTQCDYETAEYVGCLNGMYGSRERWKKADMLPQTQLPFADTVFNGFRNYDIYLRNLYGDYMKLPPEEKQIPHGAKAYRI